jgi:hypothetical protein
MPRPTLLFTVGAMAAMGIPFAAMLQTAPTTAPAVVPVPPAAGQAPMPRLTGAALEKAVQSVLPLAEEERWLQIPWRTNLMEARAESQRTGRPLFLWVMNGHPLGCT